MDYKGIKCPVCEKPFTDNDDIVVCPKCGAPYHRACYTEKGECIFTELHENGESWLPPEPPKAPNTTNEIKDKECPNCGVLNAHSALFCNICGASLTGSPEQHRNTGYGNQQNTGTPYNNQNYGSPNGYQPPMGGAYHSGFGSTPFAFDPMGGANPAEILSEDVTYGEASKLVQQNSSYYMSVFKMSNTYKRNKFNFSAFLFSGGWLLYRKQYKPGILVTALMLLLYVGRMALSFFVTLPIIQNVLTASGADYAEMTYVQLVNLLSQYLAERPSEFALFCTPMLCMIAMFIVMLIVGFMGNKMYMRHCVRTVQKIKKTSQNESDLDMGYRSHGGVNVASAFCLLGCYMVLQWISVFIG